MMICEIPSVFMNVALSILVFCTGVVAQVTSSTSSQAGHVEREVTVDKGEVVYVTGNDMVVRMRDGQMQHFADLPDGTRVAVAGNLLGIHDLRAGMKLERTVAVTIMPRTITRVETVSGKVWRVSPPKSLILAMANGENQEFTVPRDQKFTIEGQQTDVFNLRPGMDVIATRITEVSDVEIQNQKQLTGTMPSAVITPSSSVPILIARPAIAPSSESPPRPPDNNQDQGTGIVPLVGIAGGILAVGSVTMRGR